MTKPTNTQQGWEKEKDLFIRDVCSVVPRAKSEVRRRLELLLSQAITEERERMRGMIGVETKVIPFPRKEY